MSRVALNVAESQHYKLDDPEGDEEWEQLIPAHGHTVTLPLTNMTTARNLALMSIYAKESTSKTYTIAMLHQLKCVAILRQSFISRRIRDQNLTLREQQLTHHCANYLRQTFLCQSQSQLEPHTRTVEQTGYDASCKDWSQLFDFVEDVHAVQFDD